jgi:hypothetical protein
MMVIDGAGSTAAVSGMSTAAVPVLLIRDDNAVPDPGAADPREPASTSSRWLGSFARPYQLLFTMMLQSDPAFRFIFDESQHFVSNQQDSRGEDRPV